MNPIFVLDICGTLAFAVSRVLAAVDRKFDFFGVIILAFVTALGSRILRDILIGATPVGSMNSDIHIYVILLTIPLVYFFMNVLVKLRRTFLIR
ncbi:MAG: TRIC cation channel family protein [Crocinitomicaceae bacterium]